MHIVYYYFTESERAVNGLVFGLGSTAVGVWSDVLCVFCACIFVYVSEQGSSVCGGADCKVDHVFFFLRSIRVSYSIDRHGDRTD